MASENPKIEMSLDGGETWLHHPSVMPVISIKGIRVSDELVVDVTFQFTHEGVIVDAFNGDQPESLDTIASSPSEYIDVAMALLESRDYV